MTRRGLLSRGGLVRTANAGPLYVALEEGLLAGAHVGYLSSDAAVAEAVAKGKIDIGFTALSARFYRTAAAQGFQLIASQATDQSHFPLDALVTKKLKFAGVRDLPHKRIAIIDQESGVRYAPHRIAERFHVESTTPVFVKDPLKALTKGEADAALLPYPAALQSKASLLRISDLAQWQQSAVFVANVKPEILSVTKAYCDPHANLDVEDISRQIEFWQSLGKLDPNVTVKDLIGG